MMIDGKHFKQIFFGGILKDQIFLYFKFYCLLITSSFILAF